MLGTQDTGRRQTKHRNVRENWRSNQEWTIQRNGPSVFSNVYLFCLSSYCVLCTQCCQFLWIVHSWLLFRFSLTFLCFVCLRPVSCVPNVRNVRENRRSNQEWTIQRNWQCWVHKTQDEDKQNIELLRFSLTFLCFVFLRPVSCVPNVASFSELSILDCSFGFL
jgi:hypothetical protein